MILTIFLSAPLVGALVSPSLDGGEGSGIVPAFDYTSIMENQLEVVEDAAGSSSIGMVRVRRRKA